ncbi:hypothetical protein SprV_0301353000 [Sparganum proliferum]
MEDYLRGIDASGHGSAILAQLDDDVYDLARAAGISSSMPGTEILKNLRGILCGRTPSWLERSEFRRRTQEPPEGVLEFHQALRLLGRRAYPTMKAADMEQMLLDQFVHGVSDPEVRKALLRAQPSTMVTSMEQASNVGDTRKLYQLIRQVSGKPSTLSDSVSDVNGGFIADNSAKVERWLPCDPPPPSEGEVADTIRKLRNNKAPGADGIPAEIFKSCVDTLAPWLHEVIERAWRDELVPDDWGLGILVPILKKGDKTRCENYRGISLIDVAAKIFAIVLLRRFQAVRDSRTRPNQAGFRAGRGCADQIFTLRSILEFRHGYQQPTAVCFVDFADAFDSVHCESLWRIMALDGVPAKIIAMIKAYYRSTTARVLVRNNLSQPFGIRSGVRQGCILSPILFNYAIDWILGRALRESDGVEFAPGHRLNDLDYADDIALLASSFGDLQSMVSRVNEVAKSFGLSINTGKTKVFSSCIPDQEKAPLGIDGCQLEEVDSFKYLGARLLPNGQSKDDIVSRIDAARWVFFKPSEMPVEPT